MSSILHIKYQPCNEGIDHINIYSKSNQELGRMLSNFYFSPIIVDGLEFNSIEGYWYFIKTGCIHHHLRKLSGYKAKEVGKKLERVQFSGSFEEKIKEVMRVKLKTHRNILQKLTKSSLPLTHYYYYGLISNPKVYYLEQYSWIVEEFERIRNLMQSKELK